MRESSLHIHPIACVWHLLQLFGRGIFQCHVRLKAAHLAQALAAWTVQVSHRTGSDFWNDLDVGVPSQKRLRWVVWKALCHALATACNMQEQREETPLSLQVSMPRPFEMTAEFSIPKEHWLSWKSLPKQETVVNWSFTKDRHNPNWFMSSVPWIHLHNLILHRIWLVPRPLLQGVAGFSSETWDYLVRPLLDSRPGLQWI